MGVGSLTSYMMHIFQKESEKNWAAKQHRKLRHLDFFFSLWFFNQLDNSHATRTRTVNYENIPFVIIIVIIFNDMIELHTTLFLK